jgi:DNA gyrase/topoisomerase IV subunit B
MSNIYVLYNPHSGHNTGKEKAKALEGIYTAPLTYVDMTTITDYAAFKATLNKDDQLVVCGGDGTLNRFINEIYDLGIENDISGLRYNKIIIATDADNDGFHIRNLMLTFFLGFFEELVMNGRIFILETPLFRVRNKKDTRYCYTEAERDAAMKELGKGVEVTRFKGLGEIGSKEFGQFIGPDMHLVPVEVKALKEVQPLLEFYMGKNTPSRREFIVNNLLEEIDA